MYSWSWKGGAWLCALPPPPPRHRGLWAGVGEGGRQRDTQGAAPRPPLVCPAPPPPRSRLEAGGPASRGGLPVPGTDPSRPDGTGCFSGFGAEQGSCPEVTVPKEPHQAQPRAPIRQGLFCGPHAHGEPLAWGEGRGRLRPPHPPPRLLLTPSDLLTGPGPQATLPGGAMTLPAQAPVHCRDSSVPGQSLSLLSIRGDGGDWRTLRAP